MPHETVSMLLDAGADPARRGEHFATAYHKALQNEHLEVAELILERSSPVALGLTSQLQKGPPPTGFQLHSVRVHPTKNFAISILNDGRMGA